MTGKSYGATCQFCETRLVGPCRGGGFLTREEAKAAMSAHLQHCEPARAFVQKLGDALVDAGERADRE